MIPYLLVAVIGALITWLFQVNWNSKNFPKGPIRLPIIGNLHQVALYTRSTGLRELFAEYEKIYGKIFSFQLGSYSTVVLNDYELIKETFSKSFSTGKSHFIISTERCSDGVNRGILFQDGEEWAEQRRFASRHLREFGFEKKSMENLIMDEVVELLGRIEKDCGKPTSTQNLFNVAVLNALWTITAGERFKYDDPELLKIVEATTRSIDQSGSFQFLVVSMPWIVRIWPTLPAWTRYKADLPLAHKFLKKFTDRSLQNHQDGQRSHFTDAYINEIKSTKDPKSSFYGKRGELTLTGTLLDLFMAGAETTSKTLSWACLYLSLNPDKQDKLIQEIDRICGSKLPTLDDQSRMPYTEAVIMETLRYSSIILVIHRAISDGSVRGYQIPKDTLIVANVYAVHHDKKTWGDPQSFRPERFLSSDESLLVKSEFLIPFSIGKRVCIGETLAKNELFLFLVSIFQKFRVSLDPLAPKPSLDGAGSLVVGPRAHHVVFTRRD